jgi:hypothetical protein
MSCRADDDDDDDAVYAELLFIPLICLEVFHSFASLLKC